jgi:phage terminase large subunit-like protein
MDEYTAVIFANGGNWSESEVLGNHAVVKVRASAATLTTIAADVRFHRIPVALLDDTLASLTNAQIDAISNKVQALGYSLAEIQAALGTTRAQIRQKTLRQVLRFVASRRIKPRYDANTQAVVFDTGVVETPRSIEDVDAAVI